jgi:exodeoxyribonuclease VII small subunit
MVAHTPNKPASNFDFSGSMKELEEIAAYLEGSDVDLDEAIAKFERGAALATELKQYLTQAEGRVEQLKQDFSTASAPNARVTTTE